MAEILEIPAVPRLLPEATDIVDVGVIQPAKWQRVSHKGWGPEVG